MSNGLDAELEGALTAGEFSTARRLSSHAIDAGDQDAALKILAQFAQQDPHAADLFIEALDSTGVVHRFAAAALLDRSAVDDVAQDALISIASSLTSYDGRGKVTSWVHSIVRRRVVDHLRRQRESLPLEDDMAPSARISSMIATRDTVRSALAGLDETHREPVVLRDIEGLSYAEIAEHLNRPQGTVKAQISRGRALVAAHIRGPEEATGDDD